MLRGLLVGGLHDRDAYSFTSHKRVRVQRMHRWRPSGKIVPWRSARTAIHLSSVEQRAAGRRANRRSLRTHETVTRPPARSDVCAATMRRNTTHAAVLRIPPLNPKPLPLPLPPDLVHKMYEGTTMKRFQKMRVGRLFDSSAKQDA